MVYRVELSHGAIHEIDNFFIRLRDFSLDVAENYELALQRTIDTYLVENPTFFPPYPEIGAPYYRFLFRVTPRTAYWIVYRVYESQRVVRVLQFRSAAQEEMVIDF
jgi:hypothetical protein